MARHAKKLVCTKTVSNRDFLECAPMVLVTWLDHCNMCNRWVDCEEAQAVAKEQEVCVSLGFLVEVTPDYVLIAATGSDDGEIRNCMKVLRGCILDFQILPKSSLSATLHLVKQGRQAQNGVAPQSWSWGNALMVPRIYSMPKRGKGRQTKSRRVSSR